MSDASSSDLSVLQIGHGWNPTESGSGLDRVFYSLMHHLPGVGVGTKGLVIGSFSQNDLDVIGAASESAGLIRRFAAVRSRFSEATSQTTFDMIASHFALYTLPLLDRIRSIPLVTHFHGPWALESRAEGSGRVVTALRWGMEKLVYQSTNHFIVLSEAFRDILSQRYGMPRERIDIVPGGVDAERFAVSLSKSESRMRLGWPTDRPIVLSVRRLVRRVGLENLIKAVAHVRSQIPDVLLLIAGKGPLAPELETQIASNDLSHHVRLLGFVPDDHLPTAYRAADVSVVPTRSLEGFGLVAVESLAAGTPVLVTPVGGLPEVVRDLSLDLIMKDGSVSAIQDHLIAALKGSLKLPTSESCRSFATERYDWPVVAQQVKDVYSKVL